MCNNLVQFWILNATIPEIAKFFICWECSRTVGSLKENVWCTKWTNVVSIEEKNHAWVLSKDIIKFWTTTTGSQDSRLNMMLEGRRPSALILQSIWRWEANWTTDRPKYWLFPQCQRINTLNESLPKHWYYISSSQTERRAKEICKIFESVLDDVPIALSAQNQPSQTLVIQNQAYKPPRLQTPRDIPHCTYCNRPRHTKETCYQMHGYPEKIATCQIQPRKPFIRRDFRQGGTIDSQDHFT